MARSGLGKLLPQNSKRIVGDWVIRSMPIKVKMKGTNKILMRYNNPFEEQYIIHTFLKLRDDNTNPHPKISIKGRDGREIPPLKPPKPIPVAPVDAKQVKTMPMPNKVVKK